MIRKAASPLTSFSAPPRPASGAGGVQMRLTLAGRKVVRGALMTKESDSSFAEAHRGILSEPTHMKWKIRRMKWKMRETVKNAT